MGSIGHDRRGQCSCGQRMNTHRSDSSEELNPNANVNAWPKILKDNTVVHGEIRTVAMAMAGGS